MQTDIEDFLAEHERTHGVGRLPPTVVPTIPKLPRGPRQPKMVQTDLEDFIAADKAAEGSQNATEHDTCTTAETAATTAPDDHTKAAPIDDADEPIEATPVNEDSQRSQSPNAEAKPSLFLGFKSVDFQNENLTAAPTPSVMRTVQALHDPGEGHKRPPICYCGAPRTGVVDVHLREDVGGRKRAGVSGIWRCRRGEVCPSCAGAATARRRDTYARAGRAATEKGDRVVTLVFSVSHSLRDRLVDLMRAVKGASTAARAGGTWDRTIKPALGCVGVLVDHHVRFGNRHGWHYHQHLTVFCAGKTDAEIMAAMDTLVGRYVSFLARKGYRADAERQHVKILRDDLDTGPYTYPADHNAPELGETAEITADDHGEEESLSPLMLAERASHGDDRAAALFMEFSSAIKKTRSVVVTRSLARALEIEPKVEEPAFTEQTRLGSIPGKVWTKLIDRNLDGTFLTRIESAGRENWLAVRWWAMEQTGEAPAFSPELANEVAELIHAQQRMDDPIAKDLAQDQVEILKGDWTVTHSAKLVAGTLQYVEANFRQMRIDPGGVNFWVDALEDNAGKIARRRRHAASHTTLPMGDSAPLAENISHGSNPDHVGRRSPISQHL